MTIDVTYMTKSEIREILPLNHPKLSRSTKHFLSTLIKSDQYIIIIASPTPHYIKMFSIHY